MRFSASGAQAGDHAGGEVLDVDEAAALLAVAGDRQRLALERQVDERATTPAALARGP